MKEFDRLSAQLSETETAMADGTATIQKLVADKVALQAQVTDLTAKLANSLQGPDVASAADSLADGAKPATDALKAAVASAQ
jgi:hypothetical protein